MYIYIYTWPDIWMYLHIYIYIHIYMIHIFTHTHIDIYIRACVVSWSDIVSTIAGDRTLAASRLRQPRPWSQRREASCLYDIYVYMIIYTCMILTQLYIYIYICICVYLCPSLPKLVYNFNFIMVHGWDIYTYMVYKPNFNWGAPPCRQKRLYINHFS